MVENPSSSDEGVLAGSASASAASASAASASAASASAASAGSASVGSASVGSAVPANGSGRFDSESAAGTLTPIEPVPPFADVVASTRVRSERGAGAGRPARGVRSGFFDLRPGSDEPSARHPLATGARPRSVAQRFVRLAQSVRPRTAGGRRAAEARRNWAKAGLVTVVLLVLAVAAVPVAVLSWRSALGAEPSPASVFGAGLALVGLALLAGGLIGLILADPSADPAPPASFAALLLGRPGALLTAVGVALLLCAALAAG